MIRVFRFIPFVIFLILWLLVVHWGIELKKVEKLPITSNQFVQTIGRQIDNPWMQFDALREFYMRLAQTDAPDAVWTGSSPYAWAFWNQVQFIGSLEIMLQIAHKSGNRFAERYWARKAAIFDPSSPGARSILQQSLATSGQ